MKYIAIIVSLRLLFNFKNIKKNATNYTTFFGIFIKLMKNFKCFNKKKKTTKTNVYLNLYYIYSSRYI